MHGENLELSLKDREPVNVYVTILFLKDSIRVITYRQSDCPLNGGVLLSTWRQGRAHCTTWEELSHHRELVPSPPHESSLYSASWYKILFFLRNYSTFCESPLAVLLELFHDRVSSKGLEEAPGRTRLSWRSKLQLPQSGECCICIHFAIKIRLWCLVRIERYPFCFVFGPKRSWCPPNTQRQKPEGKLFTFF